jgi:hypothetical protein
MRKEQTASTTLTVFPPKSTEYENKRKSEIQRGEIYV